MTAIRMSQAETLLCKYSTKPSPDGIESISKHLIDSEVVNQMVTDATSISSAVVAAITDEDS